MKRKLEYDESPNKIVRAEGEFDDLTYSPDRNVQRIDRSEETGLTPLLRDLNIQGEVEVTPREVEVTPREVEVTPREVEVTPPLRWGNMEPSDETGLTPLLGLANIQQPAVAYIFPNMSELPADNHLVFNYNDLLGDAPRDLNSDFIGEMVACKAH
jgi:hypothetical protein